jgi:hypothetical protein
MHVTHAPAALRILEDGQITRGLIRDESKLNAYRTTVTWLSPNHWVWGSRYGNVEFSFDFESLANGRRLYWVESIDYSPSACRFLVTDQDVSSLPVSVYDPDTDTGPLRRIAGEWWWKSDITLELMFDGDLSLSTCQELNFVRHHANMCAIDIRKCTDIGKPGDVAGSRIIAYVLSRNVRVVDHLLVGDKNRDISSAMEQGLSYLPIVLGACSNIISGVIAKRASVEALVRSALLQFAMGDIIRARSTVSLAVNDDAVVKALGRICADHIGVYPKVLTSMI